MTAQAAAVGHPITQRYLASVLALKGNLASPQFTGNPTAPTAAPGTNTTQLATTAFSAAAITAAFSAKFVAAPAAANSTGVANSWSADADYIYICTATNTWKRVAIATWP